MFLEGLVLRQLIALFWSWPYLDTVMPLFVILYTNVLLIILSIVVMTVAKRRTQLFTYQDDDERFMDSASVQSFYLYVVRLYLLNCLHLELGSIDKVEEELDLDDPLLERNTVLIIEFLNSKGKHVTKLQLDMDLMRRCFKHKFFCQSGMPKKPKRLNLNRKNENQKKLSCLYLVKFCFQRHEPLKGISELRIRQLERLPLHLYRVEIQDTGHEKVAMVCHVNSKIEPISENFECVESHNYTPAPFDRTFSTHKLIWVEMMLIFLFGLNIQSLISVWLIDFYEQSFALGEHDVTRIFWIQCFFGSLLPAVLSLAVLLFYRIFTKLFPHTRKLVFRYLSLLMRLVIVITSIISMCHALYHELIFSLDALWHKWVAGYLFSVLIYLVLCTIIITVDLLLLNKF